MSTKTEEKDGGKEQVGDRPAKLNEKKKKSDRGLERAQKQNLKRHFLLEEQH